VGIHRLYFKEGYFGSLSAADARTAYAAAEARFRAHLAKLNVPANIVDRLFATDSKSMYYLTKSDLELIQSTPYLEELTQAKCPPDKTKHEYYPDGQWKSTTSDPVRINCYRTILKEVMRDGVRSYLAGLGEQPVADTRSPSIPITPRQPVVPVTAPAANPPPVTPSVPNDATSVWIHSGSTVYLVTSPANGRKFLYEIPKPAIQDGPKDGSLLFDGKRQGQEYVGTAYAYWGNCKTEQYSVRGRISSDEKKIVLRGRAPQKNSNCDALGFKAEELVVDHKQNLEPGKH
jgi:hypothetical protein